MLKRVGIFIFSILIPALLLAGCVGDRESATTQASNETVQTQEVTEPDQAGRIEESGMSCDSLLPGTYKVPLEDIYIDVPNYKELEEGMTQLFIMWGEKYVAFTTPWNAAAATPEEAHAVCFDKLVVNMAEEQGGINGLTVESDEKVTINGIDMYKFEGKINYGTNTIYDGYAIGYAFIMDGIPCEIVGSVIDKTQSEEFVQEIKDVVEAMAASVRSDP